jgi:hypothetical protein
MMMWMGTKVSENGLSSSGLIFLSFVVGIVGGEVVVVIVIIAVLIELIEWCFIFNAID